MRVLLDEQLNWRLARVFRVCSVRGMGWTGMRSGDLLDAAEQEFDALVTMDRNMEHQQHLPQYNLAVILLIAWKIPRSLCLRSNYTTPITCR